MIILGVDGGATKTEAQVANENLEILAEAESAGSNYQDLDPQIATSHIKEAIEKAAEAVNLPAISFDSSCFGLAGLDTKHDFEVMEKEITEALSSFFKKPPLLVNDTQIAFASGSEADFGIVLIAGTGSNCWGRNSAGEEVWVSGLGHILSDQGSAYEMGQKALKIGVKSFDGRCEKTTLEDLITGKFGVSNMREVKDIVHSQDFSKSQIAELAQIVSQAEGEGDWAARQIIWETSDELAQIVYAVVRRLGLENEEFDLVLSGSVIGSVSEVRERFEEKVRGFARKVHFIIPQKPPVYGALKLALKAY